MSGARTAEPRVIDTADTVIHIPTGETWVVACVEDGRLSWVGWWPGSVPVEDCRLKQAATAEERFALLTRMAAMHNRHDARCLYARWRLGLSAASDESA